MAAIYLLAGMRHLLSRMEPDPAILSGIADTIERMAGTAPIDHDASIRTAARWMRALDPRQSDHIPN